RDRKIFFYDFRSAIRLNEKETRFLAGQLAEKLNKNIHNVKALIPVSGWSEADQEGGPLYDPSMSDSFVQTFRQSLNPRIEIQEPDLHINDPAFAKLAATIMDEMLQGTICL
ncbi:MAG: Tm-1-like ATP-binding domain-containing protein, partial [Deltaproteobacteria bacterium]|nr:Tm-1-like ATP-binding domain-containing protein [Deltaproteobacteria bacterium]